VHILQRLKNNMIRLYTLVRRQMDSWLRAPINTLVSPWISALLFIFIFGFVLGGRIEEIGGISYLLFVFPGILAMNILSGSFMQASNGLYFQRFMKTIEELLVSPLSYFEIMLGFVLGGIIRALVIGGGILMIGLIFGAVVFANPFLFLYYAVVIAAIFSLLGIIVGLWANSFEQLGALNIFVITPLSFLGGMFNTLEMLPSIMQKIVLFNPFFYFIDGMRYAMTGVANSNLLIGNIVLLGLLLVLGTLTWYLFKIGWRIRE